MQNPFLKHAGKYLPPEAQARMALKTCYFDKSKITDEVVSYYAEPLKFLETHHALIKTAEHLVPENYHELQKQYRHIDTPTLLIWGRHDKVIPLSVGKKLNKEIRSSKLVVFERCGHNPQEELPKKTASVILKFLP